MRDQPRAPRTYELMTILHPEVVEDELPTALERIATHVADNGGTVTETLRDSPWGRRRLAYPIRHGGRDLRDGYYTVFHFDIAPGRVESLERDLKLNTQVIRYLVTSYEPKPLDPRAVEEAELAAEDAAAAAYAAAQAEAQAKAEAAARAAAPSAEPAAAPESMTEAEPAAAEPDRPEAIEAGAPAATLASVPEAAAPEPAPVADPTPEMEPAVGDANETGPAAQTEGDRPREA